MAHPSGSEEVTCPDDGQSEHHVPYYSLSGRSLTALELQVLLDLKGRDLSDIPQYLESLNASLEGAKDTVLVHIVSSLPATDELRGQLQACDDVLTQLIDTIEAFDQRLEASTRRILSVHQRSVEYRQAIERRETVRRSLQAALKLVDTKRLETVLRKPLPPLPLQTGRHASSGLMAGLDQPSEAEAGLGSSRAAFDAWMSALFELDRGLQLLTRALSSSAPTTAAIPQGSAGNVSQMPGPLNPAPCPSRDEALKAMESLKTEVIATIQAHLLERFQALETAPSRVGSSSGPPLAQQQNELRQWTSLLQFLSSQSPHTARVLASTYVHAVRGHYTAQFKALADWANARLVLGPGDLLAQLVAAGEGLPASVLGSTLADSPRLATKSASSAASASASSPRTGRFFGSLQSLLGSGSGGSTARTRADRGGVPGASTGSAVAVSVGGRTSRLACQLPSIPVPPGRVPPAYLEGLGSTVAHPWPAVSGPGRPGRAPDPGIGHPWASAAVSATVPGPVSTTGFRTLANSVPWQSGPGHGRGW